MQRPVKSSSSGIGGANPSRRTVYNQLVNTKQQGAIGVARAIRYFGDRDCSVFVPVSDTSRYDLVVDNGEELLRIEVKTTRSDVGEVCLRTSGGNQSWSGVVKRISADDCDVVFCVNLLTGTERVFSAKELEGRATIRVK